MVLFRWLFLARALLLAFYRFADAAANPQAAIATHLSGDEPVVLLDRDALRLLNSGKPYRTMLQSKMERQGRVIVRDVKAPATVVWSRILDYDSYKTMIPTTKESEIYSTEDLGNGNKRIVSRLVVGFRKRNIEIFISCFYQPSRNSLTWTLDDGRRSDLGANVGFWYVIPHPDNPAESSRIYYSVNVSVSSWKPKLILDFLCGNALMDGTTWVKKHSELEIAHTPKQTEPLSAERQNEPTANSPDPSPCPSRGSIEENNMDNANKVTTSSIENTAHCIPKNDANDLNVVEKAKATEISSLRYMLVFSVLLLAQYNLHLYLSQ